MQRKVLPVDHRLYVSHDPDGYVRFKSAMIFDMRRRIEKRLIKEMFGFTRRNSSVEFANDTGFAMNVSDSMRDGMFISTYLMNMDQYLSKKAVKKFFPQKI